MIIEIGVLVVAILVLIALVFYYQYKERQTRSALYEVVNAHRNLIIIPVNRAEIELKEPITTIYNELLTLDRQIMYKYFRS